MSGTDATESEYLQHLADANFVGVVVTAGALGAAVGWWPILHVTVVLVAAALWLLYDGYGRWQRLRLVEDTATEPVRGVAVGRTEVRGTCEPVDEPIRRPFSTGDCVLAYWTVEEYDDGWTTIASGMEYAPFVVDDGTGSIRVDPPADATTRISDRNRTRMRTTGPGIFGRRSEPERVLEFQQSRDDVDPPSSGLFRGPKRRYTEAVLPPGEDVYVFGEATVRDEAEGSNPERLVLSGDGHTDDFIVSDQPPGEFVGTDRTLARNELGMGATLIVVFLSVYALQGGPKQGTTFGLALILVAALGVFLYGLRSGKW